MTTTVKQALVAGGLGAAILGGAIAVHQVTQTPRTPPRESINVNTGCVQNMAQQPQLVVYSENWAATVWENGFSSVNVVTGAQQHLNGLGIPQPAKCPMSLNMTGDIQECYQSVTKLAASPGTRKWLVAAGGPPMCGYAGPQVWKLNATTDRYQWKGWIPAPVERAGPFMKTPKLDGDFAYFIEAGSQTAWMKFDLNAMVVVAGNLPEPATPPVQPDIQGFTFTIKPDVTTPPPVPVEGPNRFIWTRHGGPSATATPVAVPTVTPVPPPPASHPLAAWAEQLKREGITAGCGPTTFCPDEMLTRAQASVWILKAIHGASYVPPQCVGMFVDTPCPPAGATVRLP